MNMNEITKSGRDYVGYDYKTATVLSDKAAMYLDAYKNFGWLPGDSQPSRGLGGNVTLMLKRDRKILNKVELTRLQQHFEACMDEVAELENSKRRTGLIYTLVVGLAGTAFMAGSVFAVTHSPPMILLCVLLGVPGIVGWALPHFVFKHFMQKRTEEVTPLIEQKYDEIYGICEKGNALTH